MSYLASLFKKLKPSVKIASINTIVGILAFIATVFSISITYFGYTISKAVETRNKQDWVIAQASNLKSFWNDIGLVEKNILESVVDVGSDAGRFVISAVKVLDEIGSLHSKNKSIQLNENTKLSAEYLGFVSAYAKLKSSINDVEMKYVNSVLIYSPMVNALGIHGWDEYLGQSHELSKWKIETMRPYDDVFGLIQTIITTGKLPEHFEETIQKQGDMLGRSIKYLAPPTLKGIGLLKFKNYPQGMAIK